MVEFGKTREGCASPTSSLFNVETDTVLLYDGPLHHPPTVYNRIKWWQRDQPYCTATPHCGRGICSAATAPCPVLDRGFAEVRGGKGQGGVMLIGPPTRSDLIGSGLVWYPIRSDQIGFFRGWTRPDQTQSWSIGIRSDRTRPNQKVHQGPTRSNELGPI